MSLIQPEDEGQDPGAAKGLVLWLLPKNACAIPVSWLWNLRTVGLILVYLQRLLAHCPGHENLPAFLDGDILAVAPW